MKRIVVIVLSIMIIFGLFTIGIAEDFTLHNGVKFGMSKEEAISLEKSNGLTFEETTQGNNFFPEGVFRLDSDPTTVAGRDYTTVSYLFDDNGKLNSMVYEASDFWQEPFNNTKILNTLNEKYGTPVGENGKMVEVESSAYDALSVCQNYEKRQPTDDPRYNVFYQWLVPVSNGAYVDIQFVMIGLSSVNYRVITYSYRTVEEMNAMNEKNRLENQAINNDL